jgi:hypothetical protein
MESLSPQEPSVLSDECPDHGDTDLAGIPAVSSRIAVYRRFNSSAVGACADGMQTKGRTIKLRVRERPARINDRSNAAGIHGISDEVIRNTYKHGQAKRITVDVEYGSRTLRRQVLNDGRGIDPVSWKRTEGCFGLLGMYEGAAEMRRDCDGHADGLLKKCAYMHIEDNS